MILGYISCQSLPYLAIRDPWFRTCPKTRYIVRLLYTSRGMYASGKEHGQIRTNSPSAEAEPGRISLFVRKCSSPLGDWVDSTSFESVWTGFVGSVFIIGIS